MFLRCRVSMFLVVPLLGMAGCSQSVKLEPVEGRVIGKNGPLPAGTVVFHPDAEQGNSATEEARGTIDGEGHYALSTGDRPGVRAGWYRVAVFAVRPGKGMSQPMEVLADRRYNDPKTSGLTIEVVEAYDLNLKP
jgi:hypothetical protein